MLPMKVRVSITLNIDADAWMTDYGLAREDVRGDVQSWAENLLTEAARDNGMLA